MSFGLPGVLDVLVDGQTIFSFQAKQRTPRPGEIVELIRGATQA